MWSEISCCLWKRHCSKQEQTGHEPAQPDYRASTIWRTCWLELVIIFYSSMNYSQQGGPSDLLDKSWSVQEMFIQGRNSHREPTVQISLFWLLNCMKKLLEIVLNSLNMYRNSAIWRWALINQRVAELFLFIVMYVCHVAGKSKWNENRESLHVLCRSWGGEENRQLTWPPARKSKMFSFTYFTRIKKGAVCFPHTFFCSHFFATP